MNPDRTWQLFALSLPLLLFSLFLPLLSVHTYCENRTGAGVIAFGAALLLIFLLRNRANSMVKRVFSGIGVSLCVLAFMANVVFIAYATHLCRHIFDQLR